VILCGDFNDIPTSYAYFTVKQQLSDAFLAKGWGFGQTFKKIFPTLRIDQVFYDPSMLKAVGYRKYRTPLVDHYPQFANFVVKKQGKLP
jgi:endonuclease/exonuclease/phosphatase family metal-dependent hydrolase